MSGWFLSWRERSTDERKGKWKIRQFQLEHGVVMHNITCLNRDSKSDKTELDTCWCSCNQKRHFENLRSHMLSLGAYNRNLASLGTTYYQNAQLPALSHMAQVQSTTTFLCGLVNWLEAGLVALYAHCKHIFPLPFTKKSQGCHY